ncbi:LysR family transcriptional regulator [Dyadobacter sandarakinus]|uniref:LysR family transcriptional regulator n=1 Tax=Dyadobacter sandarakinus TaxID=2747268 RepID=A0ABX7I676_9BACT|nr:LysR family transcriptional regulator [Dyadobacter sandarakinus]QRR01607.1 LysR family transcriptional regulator [Dyadobacter sandarakinus]
MNFDFRLRVFHTVAKRLNFTKAADELFITQPAITKHIRELEAQLKTKVFDRNGTKIKLTRAGELLLARTEQIFEIYRALEFEINALNNENSGMLRIGASTTVAQYVLPSLLAAFHNRFPEIEVSLVIKNTDQIQLALTEKQIDIGIIEGRSRDPKIHYAPFLNDEIVLVTSARSTIAKNGTITLAELARIPIILREPGSGTLEVIAYALKEKGVSLSDLNKQMQLAGSESIKRYIQNAPCAAFLSIHSILDELSHNQCRVIDIEGFSIERAFHFATLHGQPDGLAELFMNFAVHHKK